MLIQEEMKRVLRFLAAEETIWERRGAQRLVQEDPRLTEGLKAYAQRQKCLRAALRARFQYLWRDAETWILEGKAPESRRWYLDYIKPRDAPLDIFSLTL